MRNASRNYYSRSALFPYNDDMIYDPLPQPYRFINKILIKTIEEAIDLAEGGESPEALSAFVCHNLKLTKVGKLPTYTMETLFLSTDIFEEEISAYHLFADTGYVMAGTATGIVIVYDPETKKKLYEANIVTLTKGSVPSPIVFLSSLRVSPDNFAIAFGTEDAACIQFLASTFLVKGTIELDISSFMYESILIDRCDEQYIYVTDGTGKLALYDCKIANDTNTDLLSSKTTTVKAFNVDPVFELEKCPISSGPLTSESNIIYNNDDLSKKKALKKKPGALQKGVKKNKSPSVLASKSNVPIDEARNNAKVIVFEDMALIQFGKLPILLLFQISTGYLICDFSMPSNIMCLHHVNTSGNIAIGFENGSFSVLDMKRKTVICSIFQKKGPIKSIHAYGDTLFTFTAQNIITAYNFNGRKISEQIYSIGDDDIISTTNMFEFLVSYNSRPSDLVVCQALTSKTSWCDRNIVMVPSISVVDMKTGSYQGTIKSPINLEIKNIIFGSSHVMFVYRDPVEYMMPVKVSPPQQIKKMPVKNAKLAPSKRGEKGQKKEPKMSPVEEAKDPEPEQMIKVPREIIGLVHISNVCEMFKMGYASKSLTSRISSTVLGASAPNSLQSTSA